MSSASGNTGWKRITETDSQTLTAKPGGKLHGREGRGGVEQVFGCTGWGGCWMPQGGEQLVGQQRVLSEAQESFAALQLHKIKH